MQRPIEQVDFDSHGSYIIANDGVLAVRNNACKNVLGLMGITWTVSSLSKFIHVSISIYIVLALSGWHNTYSIAKTRNAALDKENSNFSQRRSRTRKTNDWCRRRTRRHFGQNYNIIPVYCTLYVLRLFLTLARLFWLITQHQIKILLIKIAINHNSKHVSSV